jgi:hypothetical protein
MSKEARLMRTAQPGLPGGPKNDSVYGTTVLSTATDTDPAPALTNPIPAGDDPDTGGGGGGQPTWDPDKGDELSPHDPRREVLEPAGV